MYVCELPDTALESPVLVLHVDIAMVHAEATCKLSIELSVQCWVNGSGLTRCVAIRVCSQYRDGDSDGRVCAVDARDQMRARQHVHV